MLHRNVLLFKFQFCLVFSPCFQVIAPKLQKTSKWPVNKYLEFVFVESILKNILLRKIKVKTGNFILFQNFAEFKKKLSQDDEIRLKVQISEKNRLETLNHKSIDREDWSLPVMLRESRSLFETFIYENSRTDKKRWKEIKTLGFWSSFCYEILSKHFVVRDCS